MLCAQDRPTRRPSYTLQMGGTVVQSARSTLTSSFRVNFPRRTSMSWASLSTHSMGLVQLPALFNPAYRLWSTSTGRYAVCNIPGVFRLKKCSYIHPVGCYGRRDRLARCLLRRITQCAVGPCINCWPVHVGGRHPKRSISDLRGPWPRYHLLGTRLDRKCRPWIELLSE